MEQQSSPKKAWIIGGAVVVVAAAAITAFVYQSQHSGLAQVIAAPNANLAGQEVSYNNVVVKTINSDDIVIWINTGGLPHRGLLVFVPFALQSKVHQLNDSRTLQDGQRINVSGTLKLAPNEVDLKSGWKLSSDDAQYVRDHIVYLDATTINLVK